MNELIFWNAQLSDLGNAIDIKNQQLKRMREQINVRSVNLESHF